jgi:hypothetical protein
MRVLENGGTIEQHKAAVAAATAAKFDGVSCPTLGCNGMFEQYFIEMSHIGLRERKQHKNLKS